MWYPSRFRGAISRIGLFRLRYVPTPRFLLSLRKSYCSYVLRPVCKSFDNQLVPSELPFSVAYCVAASGVGVLLNVLILRSADQIESHVISGLYKPWDTRNPKPKSSTSATGPRIFMVDLASVSGQYRCVTQKGVKVSHSRPYVGLFFCGPVTPTIYTFPTILPHKYLLGPRSIGRGV
jgi:hypothetical protein